VTATLPAAETRENEAAPTPRRRRHWPADVLFALVSAGMAGWITSGLWADPYGRAMFHNYQDHTFFEWLLGYGWQIVAHGANPFHTTLLNAPDGVNLAANTSITVYAVLFAPLTHFAGPQISYVTILTLNLAVSAYLWYRFLARWAVTHRWAAAVGALFAGFAPGWVAHANGHLNWTAGWVVPALLWWVMRLRDSRRWLLNGAVLGLLMAVAFSLAAELLFFTALLTALFVVVWSWSRATWPIARAAAGRTFAALGVSAVVAGALLAYPLYMHFAGPGSFSGTGFDQRNYVEDVASFGSFPYRSVAGFLGLARGDLASNQSEGASFYGLPLLLLIVVATIRLWWGASPGRKAGMRALTVAGLCAAVLSLGPRLNWLGEEFKGVPLPYAALWHLPIFDAAIPARIALLSTAAVAVTLALLVDRWMSAPPRVLPTVAVTLGLTLALVPLFPMPVLTGERSPEPAFIADGTWKDYAGDGQVISALPFALDVSPDAQRWQAYTMARGGPQFRIPGGYFLGPGGPGGAGRIGSVPRYTDYRLFLRPARTGLVDDIGNYQRTRVREDLKYWDVRALFVADSMLLREGELDRTALLEAMTELFGPATRVDDVYLWTVRPGVDPVSKPGDGPDNY
jgi:hypothetical protein